MIRRAAVVMCVSVCSAWGVTLSTPFNNVSVSAPAGKEVEIKGPGHKGLLLFNREGTPLKVRVRVVLPTPDQLLPDTLALPDSSWVSLGKNDVIIAAHGNIEIPVRIRIPSKVRSRQKRYLVLISSEAESASLIGLQVRAALLSRVYISIP